MAEAVELTNTQNMEQHLLDESPTAEDRKSTLRRGGTLVSGIVLACLACLATAGAFTSRYPIMLGHTFLAFTLGLRHAVDCDHLAAIDNVTRQMLARGQRPVSVGFWFAVGHSTVVVILTGVLAGGYSWVASMADDEAGIAAKISTVAAVISVSLLACLGLLNASIARSIWREWSELRERGAEEQRQKLEDSAETSLRSALAMIPFVQAVFDQADRPYKMFFVGFLFGLSFDSASQVGLIGLAAMTGTSGTVPPILVMVFPLAFSCGMCLVDTGNGLLMLATYSWTAAQPMQKLFYNFVVTAMSATVALLIGTMEVLQIIGKQCNLKGPFWNAIQSVDMVSVGYTIICSFVFILVVAICYSNGLCNCAYCRPSQPLRELEY